ncbi:MAG: phosphate signaling complex protein PhoU [Candidatus Bathyarchaeota archaeon]|nr:phosphate signaling complex protein PhoU [Candidatus Bathyarchaeota archaeon]
MHRLLDHGLEELTATIFKMGEVAEKALAIAIRNCIEGKKTADEVKELSEILVTMTVEVEEKAFGLVAKYQPVASDLRIINSYIRVAYDFERYGRYAWDIAFVGKRLGGLDKCEVWMLEYVREMGDKVLSMTHRSVEALKGHDTELAKSISKTEPEVDELYLKYFDKLVREAHVTNQCTISSVLTVRYLERIADHATYVAESIVYITTGQKLTLR